MAKQQKNLINHKHRTIAQDINPSQEGSMAPSDRIYDRFRINHLTDSDGKDLKDRGFTDALLTN